MTFPASPTFGQLRDKVLLEVGISRAGNARKHIIDTVSRYLERSHRTLYVSQPWARRNITIEVPLVAGTTIYEFPDKTYPGYIEYVYAVNQDENISPVLLKFHVNPHRFDAINNRQFGPPLHVWIENGNLVVGPAPTELWTHLLIQTKERDADFKESGDRCQVDPEMLIMKAAVSATRFLGKHDVADRLEAELTLYTNDVRTAESSHTTVTLGQYRAGGYPTQRGFRRGRVAHDLGDDV